MVKKATKSLSVTKYTKEKLDKILESKGFDEMKKNPMKFIKSLVRNKRLLPYDKEISFLADIYLECMKRYAKLPPDKQEKSMFGKVLKEVGKMNGLF